MFFLLSLSVSESSLAVGAAVPWDKISPVRGLPVRSDRVQSVVPIADPMQTGFVACSTGVVQDAADAFWLPILATPMSTSVPDESIQDIQFDSASSQDKHSELKAVFHDFSDLLTTEPGSLFC